MIPRPVDNICHSQSPHLKVCRDHHTTVDCPTLNNRDRAGIRFRAASCAYLRQASVLFQSLSIKVLCAGWRADRAPRCAAAFRVQSILLRFVEGFASCPNQSGPCAAGQRNLRNNCSLSPGSVAAWSRSPTASSRRSGFPTASDCTAASAPSGTPTFLSKESGSPERARHLRFMSRSSADRSAA